MGVRLISKNCLAECGYDVSLFDIGEYGDIYRIESIILMDSSFTYSYVSVDDFVSLYDNYMSNAVDAVVNSSLSGFSKNSKLASELDTGVSSFTNSFGFDFWVKGYTYFILNYGDLNIFGIDSVENGDTHFKPDSNIILGVEIGDDNTFGGRVYIADLVYSVVLNEKTIISGLRHCMTLDCDGVNLRVANVKGKLYFYPESYEIFDCSQKSAYDYIVSFENDKISLELCGGVYGKLSDNASGKLDDRFLEKDGYFIKIGNYVTINSKVMIPDTLVIPNGFDRLYLRDKANLTLAEDIKRVVVSKDLRCINIIGNMRSTYLGDEGEIFIPHSLTSNKAIFSIVSALTSYSIHQVDEMKEQLDFYVDTTSFMRNLERIIRLRTRNIIDITYY